MNILNIMKKGVKMKQKIIKYSITFFVLVFTFCISLTLASLIPKKAIEKNIKISSNILLDEREDDGFFRRTIYLKLKRLIFDNDADAVMINNSISIDTNHPFYSAMMVRRNYLSEKTKKIIPDKTGELLSSSKYKEYDPILELRDTVNNDITESFEYARYWHGYLIIVRPLLIILNLNQIRILFTILLIILGIILLYKIYKEFGISMALIFISGMIVCDYYYVGLSLQGVFIFLITTVATLMLFSKKIKEKKYIFFLSGILACFFDFLTVPIISLCIPLTIYILLIQKNKELNNKKLYLLITELIIIWAIAYFGTWFAKWIIVDIIYNKNMIYLGFRQFIYRSIADTNISYVTLLKQILYVIRIPFVFAIFGTLIFTEISEMKKVNNKEQTQYNLRDRISDSLPYLIITIIPIVWYVVLKEHSYYHYFFTYRNFFAITISLCIFINKLLKKSDYNGR